jgi:hypothetical protein
MPDIDESIIDQCGQHYVIGKIRESLNHVIETINHSNIVFANEVRINDYENIIIWAINGICHSISHPTNTINTNKENITHDARRDIENSEPTSTLHGTQRLDS